MRTRIFVCFVFFVLMAFSKAGEVQDNCGCGLGTTIFEGKDTMVIQVLAITSNAPTQLFGISSGTLGCEQPIQIVQQERLNIFVSQNLDNIAMNISKGQGEYLDTISTILKLPAPMQQQFYSKLQSNFTNIFHSESVSSTDVTNTISRVFSRNLIFLNYEIPAFPLTSAN